MLPVERCNAQGLGIAPFNREHHPIARSRLVEACVMFRRPSAAPPTAPIVAPETPRTWVKVLGLVEPWPRPLPGMPPPAPLAMGWPTVAVKYRYSSNATVLTENERSRTPAHLGLALNIAYSL